MSNRNTALNCRRLKASRSKADEKQKRAGVEQQKMQDFQNMDVRMKKHIVRIVNDEALMQALNEGKHRAALKLAQKIREDYQQQFGEELQISARSLACEIYWHYYVLKKVLAIEKRFGKQKITSWLIRHIDVSDCGEKKEDTNRWVWDLLSIVF